MHTFESNNLGQNLNSDFFAILKVPMNFISQCNFSKCPFSNNVCSNTQNCCNFE